MQLDDTLCYCFHISRRKIVNHIRVHQPRRASQLADCGGAGTGCGWCIPYLKRCFEQGVTTGATQADEITPADYARLRAEYIRAGKGKPAPGAIPLPE
jgi:NAD(P)H-nitrite reductase large subunit